MHWEVQHEQVELERYLQGRSSLDDVCVSVLCRRKSELLLRLLDQNTKAEKICFLRDDWYVLFSLQK